VKRRFRCYNHTSEFTIDKSKVDEKKHIYLLNRDLIENIIEENLLNTWIDILAQYANKWINGEEIPIPQSFKEATQEVIETNDNIQDFIDVKLTITTGGKADRIGKNEMIDIYKKMFTNRGINHQILKSHLCERKIDWDKEIRGLDGIKGCYINVIRRNNEDIDDHNECMFIDKTDKDKYIRAEYHKQLKDKMENLEETNKNMKTDLNDMMKYITQLESYVYKMESIDDEQSNEIDVDVDEDVVDEDSDETDVDVDEPSNECMLKKLKQSNEIDDVDVDEPSNKDIDFIEIGNNVYLNKKTNKTYEIADDDDLNEDLF
jgi:hypothetical protein